jgi:hypothetical protein
MFEWLRPPELPEFRLLSILLRLSIVYHLNNYVR